MSKRSDLLEAIKQLFKKEVLEDAKGADGEIYRIEGGFAVGAKVSKMSGGQLIVPDDDDIVLADGREFTVANGIITAITKADKTPDETTEPIQPITHEAEAGGGDGTAKPAEVTDGTPAAETTPESTPDGTGDGDLESRVATLEAQVEELMGYINEMAASTTAFKDVKKKMEKQKEDLQKRVDELEKTPVGDPIAIKASKVAADKTATKMTYTDVNGMKIPNRNFQADAIAFNDLVAEINFKKEKTKTKE